MVSPLLESIFAPEPRYPTTKTSQIQSSARPDLQARKDVAIGIVVIVGSKSQIRKNLYCRRANHMGISGWYAFPRSCVNSE